MSASTVVGLAANPATVEVGVTTLSNKQAEYIDVSTQGPFKPDTYRY